MRTALCCLLVLLVYCIRPAAAQTPPAYPDSCHFDFSFLRDRNAFHRGFLQVGSSGHFYWPDGTRARFWGVNISNRSLWIPHDEIDRVVDVLARAGTNLVRFEALDSRGGLLEADGLDRDKLDTLHYWIHQLRQRGIAYYLDLLDFRDFSGEVENGEQLGRAAKPYACFDPKLIELQQQYASQLLTARNPYTGLRTVDDPAFVLLEICNEHGFFLNPGAVDHMVDPYRGELQKMWGDWLLKKYGSREALAKAWGSWHNQPVLQEREDPEAGTVELASMSAFRAASPNDWDPAAVPSPSPNGAPAPPAPTPHFAATSDLDLRATPARLRDGVQFYYAVQRGYFRSMHQYLRKIGVRIPITAVVSNDISPDLASVAAEMDFLSENYYHDHPRFVGKQWQDPFYYQNRNGLHDGSSRGFAPYTTSLRWDNKPVVIREWGTVWPNRYRCASVPEAAAYARLQDYDAMILFGYKTAEAADHLVEFGYQSDPTVWGLYALGATVFLRGDVQPAVQCLNLVYSVESLFSAPDGVSDLHRLAWILRLNSTIRQGPGGTPQARETTGVDPGTASSASAASQRTTAPPATPAHAAAAAGSHARLPLASRSVRPLHFAWGRDMFVEASPLPAVEVMARAGFASTLVRAALDRGVYTSATGEIVRRLRDGRLEVETPQTCMIAGELPPTPVTAGALTVESVSPVGAVVAQSLDGLPLSRSRRYIVKMVTVAENSGQDLELTPPGSVTDYVLRKRGEAPVVTDGQASSKNTVVKLNGRVLAAVGLSNGTWELLVDGDRHDFWCDTTGVTAVILGQRLVTSHDNSAH
jgi:hypothetical protein